MWYSSQSVQVTNGFLFVQRARNNSEESDLHFGSHIKPGDVVIANHSSAVEVLLLSFWLRCPRFAFPIVSPGSTGLEESQVVVLDFFDAIRQACGSQVAFTFVCFSLEYFFDGCSLTTSIFFAF